MKIRESKKQYEDVPTGTHVARVVGLSDLGHQPGFVWEGGVADSAYKVELTYELVDTPMSDGRPFWISEDLTNTDNEGGNLAIRVSAAGVTFSSIEDIIDKPVMVTVGPNKKGTRQVVKNVAGVPSNWEVSPLSNEPIVFDIYAEEPDYETFASFSQFKRDKITNALDFNETALYKEHLLRQEEDQEDDL